MELKLRRPKSEPESEPESEPNIDAEESKPNVVRQTSHVSKIARHKRRKKNAGKTWPKRFAYKAINNHDDGKKVKGTMTVQTQHEVYASLINSGHTDISVKPARSLLAFEITKKKVKKKKIAAFARQMSVFMTAGVPIVDALGIIGREVDDKALGVVIADIVAAVRDGDNLSVALGRHPEAFSKLFVAAVGSAEQTGQLDVTLLQMADYIEREVKMKSTITSALIYPGVVTVMGAVTIVVLSVFVLPRFQVFFASLNAKLPLPTRMLMSVSAFLSTWGISLVGGIFLLFLSVILFRKTTRGRFFIDTWMLRLPVIGPITTYAVIERICRVLASMLRAGVDLMALRLTAQEGFVLSRADGSCTVNQICAVVGGAREPVLTALARLLEMGVIELRSPPKRAVPRRADAAEARRAPREAAKAPPAKAPDPAPVAALPRDRIQRSIEYYTHATEDFNAGRVAQAVNNFRLAVSFDPRNARFRADLEHAVGKMKASSLESLVDAMEERGRDLDSAHLSELADAANDAPERADLQSRVARILLRGGETKDAVRVARRAVAAAPDNVDHRMLLAKAYQRSGLLHSQVRELRALLALQPKHAEAASALASIDPRMLTESEN